MINVRGLAALAITPLLQGKGSLNYTLQGALNRCEEKDRALVQQLCYGVCRNYPKLEAISHHLLDKPMRQADKDVYALLLVGLYQLLEMRIPAHAAISETVEACHQIDKSRTSGLLNAILRRFAREKDDVLHSLQDLPEIVFNHPDWFIQKLRHNWPENWEAILKENNCQAPMTLRVNLSKVSRETYLDFLRAVDIEGHPSTITDSGIVLEHPVDVCLLPHFQEGFVSVQDEAAQLSGYLLKTQPSEKVLDACAAPGGKLCHLLELNAEIQLDAIEIEASRAVRIQENLERLQVTANLIIADASESDWWDGELYDKILVDAPCSATGVIRRNPDIKLLRKGEDIHALATIQWNILSNLWPMLKPGGTLLYATCSIFSQENERLIERFLKAHHDAQHQVIDASWGMERKYGRQMFPQQNGHDGFYYALLTKA